MEPIHIIMGVAPIILGIYATIICSHKYVLDRRKKGRRILMLSTIASLLMLIGQVSWFSTFVLEHRVVSTEFSANIWAVYNSLTMLIYILLAHGNRRNVEKLTTSRV